ncbi:MAG: hypothetical protein E2O87_06230 [Bacteroidetes bacterium]|nr:MAG: hypothetical protein E2O87_06230 [Bacteroidota bacterium]
MRKLSTMFTFIALLVTIQVLAQELESKSNFHELTPSAETIVWGYYSADTEPVLRIKSGDLRYTH